MPGPARTHPRAPAAALAVAVGVALAAAAGCPAPGPESGPTAAPLGPEDREAYRRLEGQVSKIVDEQTRRFASLRYEYSEGLLDTIDAIDRSLADGFEGEPPRFLPELDAEEERAHFRETIRRWEAKTGKDLRAEVDRLQAQVAARDDSRVNHPEFQREFSKTFDDFVAVEVEELRERRNRAIHAAAEALFAPEAGSHPEAVRRVRELIDRPPYNLPASAGTGD